MRASLLVYRLLLFAFPPDVRREFGDDMAAMFARQIEEARNRASSEPDDERRRYFRLTPAGELAATSEARRLEALVHESRAKKLLTKRG